MLLALLTIFFAVDALEINLPFIGDFEARGTSYPYSSYRGKIHIERGDRAGTIEFSAMAVDDITGETILYQNSRMAQKSSSKASPRCSHGTAIPPLNSLLTVLSTAQEVDPIEIKDDILPQCAGETIYSFSFVGQTYLGCLGPVIVIQGPEFVLTIRQTELSHWKRFAGHEQHLFTRLSSCRATLRTHEGKKDDVKKDLWWKKTLQAPHITMRDCVFLHGSGQTLDGPATPSYPEYWGNVSKFTPQCRTLSFIHLNTRDVGWQDAYNQNKICKLATKNSSNVISNTMVFTHSMGGLLFAGALQSGKCSLGSNSVWYASQLPVYGSSLINFLANICANTTLRATVGNLMGLCAGTVPSGAYQSMIPTNPALAQARTVIKSQLTGMMCGTSAYGLNSKYGIALQLLATIGKLEDPNDGMVSFDACSQHIEEEFSDQASAYYYEAAINHADGTCRNGNGWWGDDRMPCDFFTRPN